MESYFASILHTPGPPSALGKNVPREKGGGTQRGYKWRSGTSSSVSQ